MRNMRNNHRVFIAVILRFITVNLLEVHNRAGYTARAMVIKFLSRLVWGGSAICTLAGTAHAQWDFKTDVKSQISISAIDCSNCDLTGRDFHGTKMTDSNLSGAILNRVNLSGGSIINTNLSGAHLQKAFLVRVNAQNVIFRGANLNNATLTEIVLTDSDLQSASMTDVEFRKGSIINSNLKGANLGRVVALASTIKNSDLSFAILDGANLTGSDFTGSTLSQVDFGTANLSAANLSGTQLSGAKMSLVRGLTQEQLDTACGDGETDLPVMLTISYCEGVAEVAMSHNLADHDGLAVRDREIALRTERALLHTEKLIQNASTEDRLMLQRIHLDLLAIQRKVEE